MRPGKEPHLARDVPHVVQPAPVRADPLVQDPSPHACLLDGAEDLPDLILRLLELRFGELLLEAVYHVFLHDREGLAPLLLLGERHSFGYAGLRHVLHAGFEVRVRDLGRPLHLGLTQVGNELLLHVDQLPDPAVRDLEPLQDVGLRNLDRASLHHDDRVPGAGHDHVHVRVRKLLEGGVQDPVSADAPDPDPSHRGAKGDLGQVQRRGRPEDRQHVRVVLLVGGENRADDLRLVHEPVRKERAERAVDLPRRQDLLLLGAPFPLEEPPRDLPRRVRLLPILDREREEGEVRGAVLDGRRAEDHGLAELHQAGPVGQLGQTARFQRQGPSRELSFDSMHHVASVLQGV